MVKFKPQHARVGSAAALGFAVMAAAFIAAPAWAVDTPPPADPALLSIWPRLGAAGASFGFIFFFAAWFARWKPLDYFIGMDGRVSNSQTQLVLWSTTVLGAYLTTVVLRASLGLSTGDAYMYGGVQIPTNLLALSGFSGLTFAGARAVTTSKNAVAKAANPAAGKTQGVAAFSDLFHDDNDPQRVDLGDAQMIIITFIAIATYLAQSFVFWSTLKAQPSVMMPDVDTYLLASFGIGQGAYLAKKAGSAPGDG
jgi:hypothetical protein